MSKKAYTNQYKDLPGKPGITECRPVSTPGEALRLLKRGIPIDAAGENGALNGYRDSEGMWRAVFYRRLRTLSDERFGSLVDLAGWFKKWFPELGDQEKLASL